MMTDACCCPSFISDIVFGRKYFLRLVAAQVTLSGYSHRVLNDRNQIFKELSASADVLSFAYATTAKIRLTLHLLFPIFIVGQIIVWT